MKKFIQRVQDLSQKAAHLKQAVEAAPAQAAQLRDTVLMTASQLQQMRADVQSSVAGLRVDNGDRLTQALREVNDSAATFLEAGYELKGVDMDISPVQRLIVRLEKIESVAESTIRSLLSANSGRQTAHAILSALAKADLLTEKVSLSNLNYRELVVHVGPTPSVRLCWRADDVTEEIEEPKPLVGPIPPPHTNVSNPPPLPAFEPSSYFEPRVPATAAAPVKPTETDAVTKAVSTAKTPITSGRSLGGSDWKQTALDRFKKMPDASKYRR